MITSQPQLPEFLRNLLANCPRAGSGVHNWLYSCARHLHPHYTDKIVIADMLEAASGTCGRFVPRREIEAAVKDSEVTAWQPSSIGRPISGAPTLKWPEVNPTRREAVIKEGCGLADLRELSPVRLNHECCTEQIIDCLFPGNPLLCCGESSSYFNTRPREEWRGQLSGLQLIVPSPMTARTGLTKDGRISKHSLANTGPRRFLICEFDQGTTDEQAAILLHLASYGPLVLAVHSGGKSLHGWFYVAGGSEDKIHKFFRYAVSLGADPKTWTRSQFVRMPDGQRDNGKRQSVYFLNLQPLEIH